jgi:hypothetical protein
MNISHHNRLEELKIKAAILLKDLGNDDPVKHTKAAERLLRLPFLAHSNTAGILSDRGFFRLKHAQAVIAIENGCTSWDLLRKKVIEEDCLYHRSCGGYLNVWFAHYDEAKAYHATHGGYLLQFRKDYIVCTSEYIKCLGLAHMPDEWHSIGYNWIEPRDKEAWKRLFDCARNNYLKR